MAVTIKKQEEAPGKIGGPTTRARESAKRWITKDGETICVSSNNAIDFVNIRGWSYTTNPVDTAKAEANPEGEKSDSTDEADTGQKPVDAPTDKRLDVAVTAFESLRAEARLLGIDVKQNMGVKKLNELIAAAKADQKAE